MIKSIFCKIFSLKPQLTAEQAYAESVREARQWYLNEHDLPVRSKNASWFTVAESSAVIDAPAVHVTGQITTYNHPALLVRDEVTL